jgi:hypothetical protein
LDSLTQEQFEAMGQQSVCCGDVGDEATTFPKHIQAKALEQTIKDSVPDSVGITHFLKEKQDGSLKGRTVAGGNKQRDYISKEDASLPTVATEAMLLSCIIDAEEERDVTVIDVPNTFIQT